MSDFHSLLAILLFIYSIANQPFLFVQTNRQKDSRLGHQMHSKEHSNFVRVEEMEMVEIVHKPHAHHKRAKQRNASQTV